MKTLKITETTHRDLSEIQAQIYKEQGIKLTYTEIITALIIVFRKHEHEEK